MKQCYECKHQRYSADATPTCVNPFVQEWLQATTSLPCKTARRHGELCGKSGRYFELKLELIGAACNLLLELAAAALAISYYMHEHFTASAIFAATALLIAAITNLRKR